MVSIETPLGGEPERVATHIVPARFPEGIDNPNSRLVQRSEYVSLAILTDEARFPDGQASESIEFRAGAAEAEIAYTLRELANQQETVVVRAAGTSVTGAVVPKSDVILNMSELKGQEVIEDNGRYFATAKPGTTWEELGVNLEASGLFAPGAPTYKGATIVGSVSTNAGGDRSYKYGTVRQYVQTLKLVLPSGELLEIQRGDYVARHEDDQSPGFFELQSENGISRRVPVPTYQMPDVPKISAGYYARENTDFIDLVIGSEGTLGIITEATIEVLKEPPTYMALVRCKDDQHALELMEKLRAIEPEKRNSLEPGGISAVEYMGSRAVGLVRDRDSTLDGAGAVLLVQIEGEESLILFDSICEAARIDTEKDINIADETDNETKEALTAIREAIPETVNGIIRASETTKVAGDPCVRPEDIGRMIKIYEEEFKAAGIEEFYFWGHGEGNLHFNAVPKNEREVRFAKKAILRAGIRVSKELGGTPMAEHGVGKNPIKQRLLRALFGRKGIEEMRALKEAFDPKDTMSPGNMFPARDGEQQALGQKALLPAPILNNPNQSEPGIAHDN